MSAGPLAKQKSEAATKGWLAVAGWGGTVAVGLLWTSWFLILLGVIASAFLTKRWFDYRAKWGMRF